MSQEVIIETFDYCQDYEPSHPFEEMTFNEILEYITAKKNLHLHEYKDFNLQKHWKSHGYGAMTYWYELRGIPYDNNK